MILSAALFSVPAHAGAPRSSAQAKRIKIARHEHMSGHVWHFDALKRCGPGRVAEWAAYHGKDGRLHIRVWCQGGDVLEDERANQIAATICGPNGANDHDAYGEADGRLRVEVGCD
jgi:hypothetical protein